MPNLPYFYRTRAAIGMGGAATCVGAPSAGLLAAPAVRVPTWPALVNAQLQLGIFPAGWVVEEMGWRINSLRVASTPLGAAGAMAPSPVLDQVDPTERGQLAYHLGTAAGLEAALSLLAPGAGAFYFPFHLTRAQQNGATFNFATAQRPDLVIFSLVLPPVGVAAPPALSHFVVWECKGHANNVGVAPLAPALNQSLSLTHLTALPGAAPIPAAVVPAAQVASQIDRGGAALPFRLQTADPSAEGEWGAELTPEAANCFLRAFYAPYLEAWENGIAPEIRPYDGRKFNTVMVSADTRVGIDAEIFALLSEYSGEDLYQQIGSILKAGFRTDRDEEWISATGISA